MQTASSPPAHLPSPELDLKAYARLVWHWAWLVLLCFVVAGAAAYVVSLYTVPTYQATSTILIDEAQRSGPVAYQDLITTERKARTYAEWMQREQTLALVAQELGVDLQTLQEGVTAVLVSPVRDTQLMQVQVEGIWPELIAAVADTLPQVFVREVIVKLQDDRYADLEQSLLQQVEELNEQIERTQVQINALGDSRTASEEVEINRLRDELAQRQGTRDSLRTSLEELRLTKVQSSDSMIIVEQAKVPAVPIRPRTLNNTVLAAIVGAMLAMGLIFLFEYLDERVKGPQDISAMADIPMLGMIAQLPGSKSRKALPPDQALISFSQPRHPITESYRALRTNLQFSSIDSTVDSLLVTSSMPSEGKTTTAANLAAVIAQSGRRVILLDADMRRPRLHLMFNLPQSPGLSEAITARNDSISDYIRPTVVPNLYVLTSGDIPPNPAELLGSQRLQQLLTTLQQQSDIVILDAPPLMPVTDAQVLAGTLKNVLLIVKPGYTQRGALFRSLIALEHVGARMLGVVMNDVRRSARGYYAYYNHYNEYYDNKSASSKHERPVVAFTPSADRAGTSIAEANRLDTFATVNGNYSSRESRRQSS